MNLGTNDKKKVGFLAVLGLIMAYTLYTNVFAGPDTPSSSSAARPAATPAAPAQPGSVTGPSAPPSVPRGTRSRSEEFHPAVRSKKPAENQVDPAKIDPTLRLDLLAKVQAVELAGGSRNVFQFGAAPPPKAAETLKGPEPIVARPFVGPRTPPPPQPPAPPPPKPTPPPIPLKFYGISTARNNGKKTAYFLDTDQEILMAAEGETVKRRYRVVRINANSVVIEDTEFKEQQTLQLVEEVQGE